MTAAIPTTPPAMARPTPAATATMSCTRTLPHRRQEERHRRRRDQGPGSGPWPARTWPPGDAEPEGTVLGALVGAGVGASIGNASAKNRCDADGQYWTRGDTVAYRESSRYRASSSTVYGDYSRRCRWPGRHRLQRPGRDPLRPGLPRQRRPLPRPGLTDEREMNGGVGAASSPVQGRRADTHRAQSQLGRSLRSRNTTQNGARHARPSQDPRRRRRPRLHDLLAGRHTAAEAQTRTHKVWVAARAPRRTVTRAP